MLKLQVFRLCCVFLTERDGYLKNYECDGPGNLIHYKMMFRCGSKTRSKTVGEDAFLVAKVQFFRAWGKTHRNMTILTMRKIST